MAEIALFHGCCSTPADVTVSLPTAVATGEGDRIVSVCATLLPSVNATTAASINVTLATTDSTPGSITFHLEDVEFGLL